MRADLERRCEAIEESYECMLAYAGQGLAGEHGSEPGASLRDYLHRCCAAVTGLAETLTTLVNQEELQPHDFYRTFIDVVDRDARDAGAAIRLVLAQPSISSQLIDNLNASIHLRALLTDLFLIDEVLKGINT